MPFVSAIGVLVFLGAFVPMIGAFVSGTVAVLVALVAQGPVKALIMFGVVVGVQQLEAHVLQPFLMGRFVSVHPLGVIVAIALGVIVAGIPGALIAVPLAASLNAVVQHLAELHRGRRGPRGSRRGRTRRRHGPAPTPPPRTIADADEPTPGGLTLAADAVLGHCWSCDRRGHGRASLSVMAGGRHRLRLSLRPAGDWRRVLG